MKIPYNEFRERLRDVHEYCKDNYPCLFYKRIIWRKGDTIIIEPVWKVKKKCKSRTQSSKKN